MDEPRRPKHVVVVDAENPLDEISGEFYWREDHEQIVAQERETAYAQGFADATAAAHQPPVQITLRVRRGGLYRVVLRLVLVFIVLAFLVSLVGAVASSVHSS
jgi:hypothetical protein